MFRTTGRDTGDPQILSVSTSWSPAPKTQHPQVWMHLPLPFRSVPQQHLLELETWGVIFGSSTSLTLDILRSGQVPSKCLLRRSTFLCLSASYNLGMGTSFIPLWDLKFSKRWVNEWMNDHAFNTPPAVLTSPHTSLVAHCNLHVCLFFYSFIEVRWTYIDINNLKCLISICFDTCIHPWNHHHI